MFKKAVLAMALGFASLGANASLTDCNNLYVRSLLVAKSSLSEASVVFGQTPTGGNVSLNVYFDGWEENRRKDVLALLMAAKATQATVSIKTSADNQCNITNDYHVVEQLMFH